MKRFISGIRLASLLFSQFLIDVGEHLKRLADPEGNQKRKLAVATWKQGRSVLEEQMFNCGIIDVRHETDFASSARDVSMRDILLQYDFLKEYMEELDPGRDVARIGMTYVYMVANLERRFRAASFYNNEQLKYITRYVFEQGVACFDMLGLREKKLLSYPPTIDQFFQEFFPQA